MEEGGESDGGRRGEGWRDGERGADGEASEVLTSVGAAESGAVYDHRPEQSAERSTETRYRQMRGGARAELDVKPASRFTSVSRMLGALRNGLWADFS